MNKFFNLLKSINTNSLVAGSAVFISVCALFISIQEVRIMRVQQKATMYPYLTVDWMYNKEGFGIKLSNSGNGLAKITSYKIFNDSVYFNNWFQVLKHYMPEAKEINYSTISTSGNIRNQMIPSGTSKNLIFVKWTDETRIIEKRIQDLKVQIVYASLLDEYWLVNNGIPENIQPTKLSNSKNEFGFE